MPLMASVDRSFSIIISTKKLKGKDDRASNFGEYHLSWWTQMKDLRKHELGFGGSEREIGRVTWILLEHSSVLGRTKELHDQINWTLLSDREIMGVRKMRLGSNIFSKVYVWSTQSRSEQKLPWFWRVHLSRVLRNPLWITPSGIRDAILTKIISLIFPWCPIAFPFSRSNYLFTMVPFGSLHFPGWCMSFVNSDVNISSLSLKEDDDSPSGPPRLSLYRRFIPQLIPKIS